MGERISQDQARPGAKARRLKPGRTRETGQVAGTLVEMAVPQPTRRTSFETFLIAARDAVSVDKLFGLFVAEMADFGYDRVNFSIIRDEDIEPRYRGFGLIDTYPEAWQLYYRSQNLARIDPVLRAASSLYRPFQWTDLARKFNLSRDQQRFMRLAHEAGLYNGIGIPFRGPRMRIAEVAMATSRSDARPEKDIDLIAVYCWQLYLNYKRLVSRDVPVATNMPVLSRRESEILVRVGHGRTDRQIAETLSISVETVDSNLRRIFQKLDAPTRAAAVAKALILGLIEL